MKRTSSTRTLLSLLLLLLTAGLLFVFGGCAQPAVEQSTEAPEADPAVAPASPAAVYQVLGEVVEVPDPDDPLSSFYVHHEAIDDFRNMEGEVQGMDSMTMPFPVAEEVSFEGIGPGDKVRMILEVDWDGDPVIQVTEIERLDAATKLEFRSARPDAAATSGGEGR